MFSLLVRLIDFGLGLVSYACCLLVLVGLIVGI